MLRIVALVFTVGGLVPTIVAAATDNPNWWVATIVCLLAANAILWWLDWKDVPKPR